ncbi:MAG TPA: ABC transporter ATP-binding protein [Clostridia bacterium]|nr:ABC transporter ATP-binding protein [Clostridia bacterium]
MSEIQPVLKLEKVKKVIGKRTIVSNISLELMPGEVFGFLGPNGAGKTTTIKMVVGLSSITDGNISIGGHSVRHEYKAAMDNVGCIVENPEMYKYMSGMDNLKIFAKMYKNVDGRRIAEVVKMVDLEHAIRDKVKTYSLGMKQRLGIAQALLHRPKLLILDEPTNGLDPAGIRDMRELLRKLAAEEDLTVFVSSHILGEMQQMCDRVCIISNGSIITTKTVEELVGMTNGGKSAALNVRTGDDERAAQQLKDAGASVGRTAEGIHVEVLREQIPEIAKILVGAEIPVFAIENRESSSLEDVFMKLTGEDK